MAQRWFQRFNTGKENGKDLPSSGRSKLWDIVNKRRVLEENPQKRTSRLSEELGASNDTVHRQIKALGKSYRIRGSVPHELAPQQAPRRVDISRPLICNHMDDTFIRKIVTYDQKWAY